MKKIFYLFVLMLFPLNVFAASGSIKASASNTNVTLNNTITVTVKVSSTGKLGSWGFGISYDKSKLSLISGEQSVASYGDGNVSSKSYTYKFKAIAIGSASITIDNGKISDWDSESYIDTSISNLTLNIKEPVVVNYSSDNNLKSISVEGFELSPSFDKKTLEYSVTVLSTTTSVKVGAEVNDKTAKVKGTGEVEVSEGVNEVNLVVTAENGTTKTYVLKITVPEKNPIVYSFREGEYNILRKLPEEIPINFSSSTIKFNDEDIVCVQNEKLGLTLLYLKKGIDSAFYIYDEKNNSVSLFNLLNSNDFGIYVLNKELVIRGLEKDSIKINNSDVIAYRLTKNSNNYVISGRNISTGNEDMYLYDTVNKTFSVFSESDYNTLISSNDLYVILTYGLSVCLLLLIIILFILNNSKKKALKALREIMSKKEDVKEDCNKKVKKVEVKDDGEVSE